MGGEKILVIDDEENFRHLFFQTLRKAGYQVRTAESGQEAFDLLRKQTFDLSLIDIKMSPQDGFSILEKVKHEYPQMKVIMITAYATPETYTRSQLLGADQCLTKPLEMSELKDAIQLTLASSS
ncbi:MAG: response regulator [Nitrospiria bacterium]